MVAMANNDGDEIKKLRREVKDLKKQIRGTTAEDALPFLRPTHETRESFDDQVEKQRRQDVEVRVDRAAKYLEDNPTSYSTTGSSERLAKDFDIPISRAMGLLGS